MFPSIQGIIATDGDGAICYGDTPKLISSLASKSAEQLDRNILMRYLRSIESTDIVVMGRTTFAQMRCLLRDTGKRILVSDETGTQEYISNHQAEDFKPYDADTDPREQLLLRTCELATRFSHMSNVHVLGGRAVYEAFAGHYVTLVHCIFNKSFDAPDKKKVHVIGFNPQTRSSDELLESNMPYTQHIDTSEYTVRVYSY